MRKDMMEKTVLSPQLLKPIKDGLETRIKNLWKTKKVSSVEIAELEKWKEDRDAVVHRLGLLMLEGTVETIARRGNERIMKIMVHTWFQNMEKSFMTMEEILRFE
jgi:hypothetical protein